MIYLASPYSHPDESMRVERFENACSAAAALMTKGQNVYSPIAHTHPIACYGELPKGWDFWEQYDRWFIERCDSVLVLQLPGWSDSRGVNAEIKMAAELGKDVRFTTLEEVLA